MRKSLAHGEVHTLYKIANYLLDTPLADEHPLDHWIAGLSTDCKQKQLNNACNTIQITAPVVVV